MSLAPTFNVLENFSTQEGTPWHLVAEGETVTGKNAGLVMVAKDPSGDAIYLSVDTQGRLNVNSEAEDVVSLKGVGDNAGSATFVTLFDITLQASTEYKELEWSVSCFRDATFELVHVDDLGGGGETFNILATPKVGSGDYTDSAKQEARFTTGGTGTQVLRVRALNLNALSQLEGSASIKEVQ